MEDPSTLRKKILEAYEADKAYEANKAREFNEAYEARKAAADLQEAKLKALQDTLGNYGDYKYVDLEDFIDPDNQNWNDYTYKVFSPLVGIKGRVGAASPIGMFISHIRDAKNTDDIKKQLELWNSYKPLDLPHNGESYVNHFIYGLNKASDYGGSRPVFPTTDVSNPGQTSTGGGTQGSNNGSGGAQAGNTGGGAQGTQGVQGAQAGVKTGNAVVGGGVQGSNNKPRMSDAEINAFLNEELGGDTTGNGTYASAGVTKGGTKTIGYEYDPNPGNIAYAIGYDPNPGNVSLAYAMRNAPEQERRNALINKWNLEHGRTGSTGYATSQGMLTSGSNGTYATGEGMQSPMPVSDNWKFRAAWKDPMAIIGHFGRGAFTDNEYNQLVNHAVNDLGFNENIFSGNIYR